MTRCGARKPAGERKPPIRIGSPVASPVSCPSPPSVAVSPPPCWQALATSATTSSRGTQANGRYLRCVLIRTLLLGTLSPPRYPRTSNRAPFDHVAGNPRLGERVPRPPLRTRPPPSGSCAQLSGCIVTVKLSVRKAPYQMPIWLFYRPPDPQCACAHRPRLQGPARGPYNSRHARVPP